MEQSIIGIFIVIILIIALREVYCWYGKINKQVEIQEKILESNLRILEELRKINKTDL